jgi:hypothetical protein
LEAWRRNPESAEAKRREIGPATRDHRPPSRLGRRVGFPDSVWFTLNDIPIHGEMERWRDGWTCSLIADNPQTPTVPSEAVLVADDFDGL